MSAREISGDTGAGPIRLFLRSTFRQLQTQATSLRRWKGWGDRDWRLASLLVAAPLFWMTMSIPLTMSGQLTYCGILFGLSLLLRRNASSLFTIMMIVLSANISSRYLYWRCTETVGMDTFMDGFFGIILVASEIYGWVILMFGFAQTVWPLKRQPEPLVQDSSLWPSVDVFVPTYNEPLKVVKPTILAALSLDWPADKLKIFILDDGRREEFRAFAESVGVGYLTRSDNFHAKAGNINAALAKTAGEFVAMFDCDHVPARSFLQVTMGGFLRDEKLALVQTPHHFLSADPFERNLGTFRRVPNEGALFYGLIQDANDLWNAAYFCGSCAVMRRSALDAIGGVALETVTEDAHTALKLHRQGYHSSYLSVPQAAGLATESLSQHIGQRIRWARGMAQIFRLDNPFLGKGLSFMQRLCYSNAMLHFFHGLPRMVFLLAPLSYLLFGAHIIQASALLIAAYSLPHLIMTNLVNSRIQGKFRHSFWAEIYETTLSWYIFRPTMVALINPQLGKFNVTAKGGTVEKEFFDWNIGAPYLTMLTLNLIGFGIGIVRLFWWNSYEADTVILNMIWTMYNLMILGAATAVAIESRQLRINHRVSCEQKAVITLDSGRSIVCRAVDYSEGGLGLKMPESGMAPLHGAVQVSLFLGETEYVFPARVMFARDVDLGIIFEKLDLQQQINFVQCTFARADAWLDGISSHEVDRPLEGLKEIGHHSFVGYGHLWRNLFSKSGDVYRKIDEFRNSARVARWSEKWNAKLSGFRQGLVFSGLVRVKLFKALWTDGKAGRSL